MKKTNFDAKIYRGRFAPSPSGELHFGSLLAAMASYADARSHNGRWLVRIDDIDRARTVKNSDLHILKTLEQCGLHWDESISYQSHCLQHYYDALEHLHLSGVTYPCTCSRKQIKAYCAKAGVYPGTCRKHSIQHLPHDAYALRIKVPEDNISFTDQIQGPYQQNISDHSGDFIVYRRDKVFSYQLSVVVDDFHSSISHVVRGYDLLDSTPKQIYLQQMLNYPDIHYAHIPLAITAENLKLSKLSQAKKVDCTLLTLVQAARFLGQKIPDHSEFDNKHDFWQYLVNHWNINSIPKMEKQIVLV